MTPIASGEHWSITCYLALMVTSPFLNVLYRHLGDERSAGASWSSASWCYPLIPTITTYNPIGSDLVWFFCLYLMGGWLRDRPLMDASRQCLRPRGRRAVRMGFDGRDTGWAQRAFGFDYVLPDYFIWQYMVPTFAASLGLFNLFAEWKMPPIRWVNTARRKEHWASTSSTTTPSCAPGCGRIWHGCTPWGRQRSWP